MTRKTSGQDHNSAHSLEYRKDGILTAMLTFAEVYGQSPDNKELEYAYDYYHLAHTAKRGRIKIAVKTDPVKVFIDILIEVLKQGGSI